MIEICPDFDWIWTFFKCCDKMQELRSNLDRTFVRTSNQRNTWSIYSLDIIDNDLDKNTKEIAPEPAIVRVGNVEEKNNDVTN